MSKGLLYTQKKVSENHTVETEVSGKATKHINHMLLSVLKAITESMRIATREYSKSSELMIAITKAFEEAAEDFDDENVY